MAVLFIALAAACGGKSASSERARGSDRAGAGGTTGGAGGSGGAAGAIGGGGGDIAPPETLLSVPTGADCAATLAVDELYLYWNDAAGNLNKMPKDGGPAVTLVSDFLWPTFLWPTFTLHRDRVYFATAESADGQTVGGTVHAIAKDGGTSTALARLLPSALEIDDSGVYLTHSRYDGVEAGVYAASADPAEPVLLSSGGLGQAQGLALDEEFVYWTEPNSIFRAPKTGGPPTTLVAMASNVIAVHDGMLYWAGSGVERMPVAGGPTVSLGEGHGFDNFRVASDGTIFGVERQQYPTTTGGIIRVDPDGRASYLVYPRDPGDFVLDYALAIDETYVYFDRCEHICLEEHPEGCMKYDYGMELLRVPQREP